MKQPLVIGLGQRFRGDDGVGPQVITGLRLRAPGRADYRDSLGDAAELLDWMEGRDKVYVIDAVDPNAGKAGELFTLDGLSQSLPASGNPASSHALSLSEALDLGRVLNKLPRELCIFGIVGRDFAPGEGLSPAVAGTAESLIDSLSRQLLEEP